MTILDTAGRDARFAMRILRKSPIFTATAILTLALAIGINTAVFSVVDAVLLEPLPYPRADRLALVSRVVKANGMEAGGVAVNGRTWEAVRDRASSVQRAVFSTWTTGVNLIAPGASGEQARYVQQQRVGADFFETLGVPPVIGRGFTTDEDRVGGPAATILSSDLWRTFFNADPSILGRAIVLRGAPYTVVGIMPDGFHSGQRADLWTPLRPSTKGEGGGENYHILVRLRDDASWSQVRTELSSIGKELQGDPGRDGVETSLSVVPLQQGMTETLRQPLLMLWTAVAIVLVIACVNLAGLLLARGSQRSREIATRMALGSGRAAVIRQLLAESIVLAMAGGAAGLVVGLVALDVLTWLARDAYEIWQPVVLNGRSVAVACALSLFASIVFGVFPALQSSRNIVGSSLLHGGSRSIAGGSSRWPRRLIIVAQVALGMVLLVSAGLLLRSFTHLQGLDPGFNPRGVITAAVSLEDERYQSSERVAQLFDGTLTRLSQAPGIESAAVSLGLPYERLLNLGFRYLDGSEAAADRTTITNLTYVSPGFFDALQVPLRRGRSFTDADRAASAPVVIVSDSFVRMYFQDGNPIGRRIAVAGAQREIVGQAADVQVRPGWGDSGPLAAMPLAFVPVTQVSDGFLRLVHGWFAPTFIVRSSAGVAAASAAMRRALDSVDPLLPFASVRSMEEVKGASLAPQRFLMALLVGLAAVAVSLAAIGIHGLIATSVTERTREIGIRMALGATTARAMTSVVMPGVILAAVGIAIGLFASMGAASTLEAFVWGVSPTDPSTFITVSALLLAVAFLASLVPALRILRLDPATTLRQE